MQIRFHHLKKKSKFLSGFCKEYSCQATLLRIIQGWDMALIMAILLDQLKLISAKLSTVCHMGNSWPNSMHMVSNYLYVKFYAAIYIVATTAWRCVTRKVSGWILKRVCSKGQYWVPCCSIYLSMTYSSLTLMFRFIIIPMTIVHRMLTRV